MASPINNHNKLTSCAYKGYLYHSRQAVPNISKASHSFKYRVMYLYLDLTETDIVFKNIPFASINQHNLYSWFRKHHMGKQNQSLSDCIKNLVQQHCGKRPDQNGKVCVLTAPTQFGFGHSPISIFYCFNEAHDKLQTIVIELHNKPWQEIHCYVFPLFDENEVTELHTFRTIKRFYASPFLSMKYEYFLSFSNPNLSKLKVFGTMIHKEHDDHGNKAVAQHDWGTSSLASSADWNEHKQGTKVFNFGFSDMKRLDINLWNMIGLMVSYPVMCCSIAFWILWETIILLSKRITMKRKPNNHYNLFVNPITIILAGLIHFLMVCVGKLFSGITIFVCCIRVDSR
eukprot:969618_1